jgi:hypothetical protein
MAHAPIEGSHVLPTVSFQSIPILIDGHDTQGLLALFGGQLVAVLSRLDGEIHDADLKGRWHLEAGFGPCQDTGHVFATRDDITAWVTRRTNGSGHADSAHRHPHVP